MFKKIRFHTHENIGSGPIHLPEQTLHTTGYWITVDEDLWRSLGRETLEAGLQGMAHTLRHVASLRLMCDPRDLGAVAEVRSVTTRLPTVTVYEMYPGGVGYSTRMYELHRDLLEQGAVARARLPMPRRVPLLHRTAAPRGRSQGGMSANCSPRAPYPSRGAAAAAAQGRARRCRAGSRSSSRPYGDALLRQDVIPLPALDPNPGSVAYVDTETTGLSGGAGTYVFAAAVARPIDCGLRVAQVFLPQPGMEAAFLHALQAEIAPADAIATFNGSSFDLPVLRTRWVMARMPGELTCPPHVDLLTLVRALYRHRLESCNLRSVEERLLGYERDDPIASALVPDAYFEYLRHDVSPLPRGGARAQPARRDQPRPPPLAPAWRACAAATPAWTPPTGSRSAAIDSGAARAPMDGGRCAMRPPSPKARHRRRPGFCSAGAWCAAVRSRRPTELLDWLESHATEDMRVSIARARLLEWRKRDPLAALDVVEGARRRMPDEAEMLESRLLRLRRKARKTFDRKPAVRLSRPPCIGSRLQERRHRCRFDNHARRRPEGQGRR